jgi:hypothetical protein
MINELPFCEWLGAKVAYGLQVAPMSSNHQDHAHGVVDGGSNEACDDTVDSGSMAACSGRPYA